MIDRYIIEDDGCDVLIDGHIASDRDDVHINDAFRQCLADVIERDARIAELEAKLAACERQEPVASIIDIGDESENLSVAYLRPLPPVGTKLYANPLALREPSEEECERMEEAYGAMISNTDMKSGLAMWHAVMEVMT